MADNIRTKDRDDADLDIAAKDIDGVQIPRNILVDPDGNDVTPAQQATLVALLTAAQAIKAAAEALNNKTTAVNTGAVTVANFPGTQAVSGTFWQNTQPVSVTSLPLPSGAATDAGLAAIFSALGTPFQAGASIGNTVFGASQSGAWSVAVNNFPATQPVSFTWAGLTDAQLRATAVPVSAAALPLPAGAATDATLGGLLTDTQLRAAPLDVEYVAPPFVRVGFAEVGSGIVGNAANELQLLQTGSGMAVSQSGGNLVITTGTTTNAETVIRSVDTFSGSLLARMKAILSQRIANQTFRFELADLVGDGLAFTINSATSVTVAFPATNPFTAANVGQSVRLSRISGAAGIPGRYAIASVSGLSVTFTVAAWPASGSGTLTLYGWNYIQLEYSGTTATQASFDAQRRGWNSGNTTATINTTASPGHVAQLGFDVFTAGLADALVASNTGYQWTNRGSRIENIPDPDVALYLFIVVQNGSSAPASTTTMTVGFVQIEDQGRQKVRIASSDPVGSHALPVQVMGGNLGTQAVSGTLTSAGTTTNTPVTPTQSFVNSGASTNATSTKASAGTVWSIVASNINAAVRYLKLYNKASAPTVGSDTPVLTIPIPAGGLVQVDGGSNGLRFGTGIAWALTTGATDADTGAVAAGEIKVGIAYT